MKQAHLFFIKITLKNNKIYYYSMIYYLEKIQSTTIKNVITIVKNLINEYELFDISNAEYSVMEITGEEKMRIMDLNHYLKNLIYYDSKLKRWVSISKNEPDYNILNCIKKDISIKLMLIGNEFNGIIKDNKQRESIIDLFELYYHVRPSDIVLYKSTNENGTIEVNDIFDCIPKDKDKIYTIILEEGYDIFTIKEFSDKSENKFNTDIFVKISSDYYKVTSLCNEVNLKKLNLR